MLNPFNGTYDDAQASVLCSADQAPNITHLANCKMHIEVHQDKLYLQHNFWLLKLTYDSTVDLAVPPKPLNEGDSIDN